ncbi:MAG: nucleoside-diphosphate kinase, partial [Candidatus Dormibacteraceae bacterium]
PPPGAVREAAATPSLPFGLPRILPMAQALLILKPDAGHRLAVRSAVAAWLAGQEASLGARLEALTWFQPSTELIEAHYDFLRGRPFFPWLVDFMTALPVLVGRVAAEPAMLETLRYELGETFVQKARPGSLRERYGIYAGVNCLHLSDSPESGEREIGIWSRHVGLDRHETDLDGGGGRPDHTFHLRSLASQIAAGEHAELAKLETKRLLKEESGLEGTRLEALCRVILGAFS